MILFFNKKKLMIEVPEGYGIIIIIIINPIPELGWYFQKLIPDHP
jgi:hypothetical protein